MDAILLTQHFYTKSRPKWTGFWISLAFFPSRHKRKLSIMGSQYKEICPGLRGFDPWVGKIPWRRAWQPTPIFLPGNSMDRGPWRLQFIGSQLKSRTQLKRLNISKVGWFWGMIWGRWCSLGEELLNIKTPVKIHPNLKWAWIHERILDFIFGIKIKSLFYLYIEIHL